jgi:diacylglycerol O-acyltransferase / wax synthase
LIAAVPISLRKPGDTTSDNQASMSLISLGTHIADTLKRLEHIRTASAAMKSTLGGVKNILPTDFPSLGMPWLIEAAASLYGKAKVADRIPQVANVAISNVPGPPMPLYLARARMLSNYPTSIVVHGMALNITVQSYAGSLDFGMMADAKAMPDVKVFAQAAEIAFDDLRALPLPHELQAEANAPAAVVGRAVRSVRTRVGDAMKGAMQGAVKGAVGGAVKAAVNQVVQGAVKAASGTAARAAPKRSTAAATVKRASPSKRAPPSKRAAPRKTAAVRARQS